MVGKASKYFFEKKGTQCHSLSPWMVNSHQIGRKNDVNKKNLNKFKDRSATSKQIYRFHLIT